MSDKPGTLRQMAALNEELARRSVLDFLRRSGRRDAGQIASGAALPYAVAIVALDELVHTGASGVERSDGAEFYHAA